MGSQLPQGVLDSCEMFAATFDLGEQIDSAYQNALHDLEALDSVGAGARVRSVAVLGMGGSGVAGDITAAIAGPRLPIPLTVSKDYEGLAFVTDQTLVFACSASGNTEETVAATRSALEGGATVIAVTKGGTLGELVASAGGTVITMDPNIVQPRAGIGAVSIPVLATLGEMGLLADVEGLVGSAANQVRARLAANEGMDNSARTLARRIERTQPVIYGAGRLGHAAGARLKCQINENAKCPAYATAMPELCHNEICGWGQHGDVTRQVNTILCLRHDFEHPQIRKRFDFLARYATEAVAEIFTVNAEGATDLAQLFDLVVFGDLVSLWMAVEAGVDPGPVPILAELKEYLVS